MIAHSIETIEARGELTDTVRRWEHAMNWSFGNPPADEDGVQRWWRAVCADHARLRGAWPSAPEPGMAQRTPYATFASLDGTINTGHGNLEPADLITDVTVRTSVRRNGLLTELMRIDLSEAAGRGLTLAALTASEATIYRRFGFGPATETVSARLHTGAGLALRAPQGAGRMGEIDLEAAPAIMDEVFAAFHAASRGSHARPAWSNDHATGVWSALTNSRTEAVRAAAHWDEDGSADGVVTFTYRPAPGAGPDFTVEVIEMIAAHGRAELALWHYLASIDLVGSVSVPHLNPASPLPWALADPRHLGLVGRQDLTWLRVLDVPGALRVRGWDGAGRLSIEVLDPLGLSGGVYVVDAGPDGAEVAGTEGPADVRMDVSTLGSLYFGVADPVAMATAGLIEGPARAVATLREMFATDEPAYGITCF
ncbi:GNAT family N-acetyltransferase [Propionibacterium australiense]|uniref:GNAT family N-acetyltransferase n=1 Tax=Propionibacterium australiense TaxID=119981 RepID=UPI000EF2082F|nr:GNAT family N-acetyltransferase [Propionibacterium australiense]RLP11025.1 GNAT family N-acetyltransferase [Propionibacterium australiense]VEH91014.1 Enhanced intracellular survival protein [Propionibacterium australiense]